MPLPIEDYAFLSDMESGALVGKDGSIDWLSFPRFDSPACFAALLGGPEHGRWLLAPAGEVRSTKRSYRGRSLVLETVFTTDDGEVAVIDCMPPRDGQLEVVRIVEGRGGTVPMSMDLVIRYDYGWIVPWVRRVEGTLWAIGGPDALRLFTPVELRGKDLRTVSEFSVSEGERVPFSLFWHPAHEERQRPDDPEERLAEAERWWSEWAARSTYDGEWAEEVASSLVVLKGLTYEPTGGVVAAATTSLPEKLGGPRNWDYRFCWLRDATFALLAMLSAGYEDEAIAWRDWLQRAVAGDPKQLQIMYGLGGERRLTEIELDWLPGYEGSVPVRQGNGAAKQFQLDVYGEVIDAVHQSALAGMDVSPAAWALVRAMLEFLQTGWKEPDEGIWEVRGPRRQFTHSKVMAWVAVDRAISTAECFGVEGPIDQWRDLRDEIKAWVLAHCVDERGALVQHEGSTALDASLLMVPLVGFLPPDDPTVVATVEAIERELTVDGLVIRYRTEEVVDGLPEGEGTFLLCSFWLAQALALMGRDDDARRLFERLLSLRNDVGLLSEQHDPVTGRMLGNLPQAFSHTALINTALTLSGAGTIRASRPPRP
jgi:GH15 family glucan-1,4-alpha-glucosidase